MKKGQRLLIQVLLVLTMGPSAQAGMKQPCGDSIPIIYSSQYNISILGIENFHPFDSKKFKKVYKGLIDSQAICPSQFFHPQIVTDSQLLHVHTPDYLHTLRKSSVIAKIVEISPLRFLPAFVLHSSILKPMKYATGGTILGVELALRCGWAINLSGGYHHAKASAGDGFCVYADVPIALHSMWKEFPELKVLIVDLDAHQGNGNSSILGGDNRVAILDLYNSSIYPHDFDAVQQVKYPVPLERRTKTNQYLELLSHWLPKAVSDFGPGLIVYNAGTDIFKDDQLGGLSVSEEGVIQRDEFVFKVAFQNRIPILMVLSGGYNRKSGDIIARSIGNIMVKNGLERRGMMNR